MQELTELNELIRVTIEVEQEQEKEQDFFYDNNAYQKIKKGYVKRKIKPYSSSRIKTRNFLSNIAYNEVSRKKIFSTEILFLTLLCC